MSNKGCKPTGIWELMQAAQAIKGSGCFFGCELEAKKNSTRLMRRKQPRRKR
jgi:hypothetical protein